MTARSLENYPALVLNADFRPLSYLPLSLWNWQDSVKACFQGRVNVVAEYDHVIRSPSFEMPIPSVIALKDYVPMNRSRRPFTRFNVFLARPFPVPVLQHAVPRPKPDLRPRDPSVQRRRDELGKRRDGVPEVQPAEGESVPAGQRDGLAEGATAPDGLSAAGRRPGFPAEFPARELGRLPVLGFGAGAGLVRLADSVAAGTS